MAGRAVDGHGSTDVPVHVTIHRKLDETLLAVALCATLAPTGIANKLAQFMARLNVLEIDLQERVGCVAFHTDGNTGTVGTIGTIGAIGAIGSIGSIGSIGATGTFGTIDTIDTIDTSGTYFTLAAHDCECGNKNEQPE